MNIKEQSIKVWSRSKTISVYKHKKGLFKSEKRLLGRYLKRGMRVLDLGCGGGRVTSAIMDEVSYIKGIDISAEMIDVFRRKCPGANCECRAMDRIEEVPGFYDLVLIPYNSVDYVTPKDNRLRTFIKIHRCLKSGGVLIFSSHNPMGAFGIWLYSRRPGTWFREAGRILCGQPFRPEGYYKNYVFNTVVQHYFGSPKQVIRDLEQVDYAYLEQCGGNLGMGSVRFNRLFETWIYYAFRKHDE